MELHILRILKYYRGRHWKGLDISFGSSIKSNGARTLNCYKNFE